MHHVIAERFLITFLLQIEGEYKKLPSEIYYLHQLAAVSGVIHYFDWWFEESKLIIITELPPNFINLHQYVSENGPIPELEARRIFQQILTTVVQMIKLEVFHRDLRLSNIVLYEEDGLKVPYIIGFDFTTTYDETRMFHRLIGTRHHFPPEFHLTGNYTCQGHTTWNLGCLLFEMLTGMVKFDQNGKAFAGSQYPDFLSAEVRNLIDSCFEPNWKNRASIENIINHDWMSLESSAFL